MHKTTSEREDIRKREHKVLSHKIELDRRRTQLEDRHAMLKKKEDNLGFNAELFKQKVAASEKYKSKLTQKVESLASSIDAQSSIADTLKVREWEEWKSI